MLRRAPRIDRMDTSPDIGTLLRDWRQRRRRSQLDLALDAEISTRHLSFVETGRSAPSRAMLLRLAEVLEIPLRERNALLLAGGFAPAYPTRAVTDTALSSALGMVKALLKAHQPYPALAIDRYWTLLAANDAVNPLLAGAATFLLEPPVNVLRLSLHPEGLAPRIVNLEQWRTHLLDRLRRRCETTADAELAKLLVELENYPFRATGNKLSSSELAVPLRLSTARGELRFLSTTMVFGTPLDVTLSELAIETFLPADEATAGLLGAKGGA